MGTPATGLPSMSVTTASSTSSCSGWSAQPDVEGARVHEDRARAGADAHAIEIGDRRVDREQARSPCGERGEAEDHSRGGGRRQRTGLVCLHGGGLSPLPAPSLRGQGGEKSKSSQPGGR